MTDAEIRPDPRYTPYQADFFKRFVAEVGPGSVHLLVAPVGTGKSFVMAGTISELVRTSRLRRVLILAPAALGAQWADLLSSEGQEHVLVDGRVLRLLRQQLANKDWPVGVYAMSIDLAKRDDVRNLLSAVSWDLVVVDEAHLLSGQRRRLVEDLAGMKGGPALLLATASNVRGQGAWGVSDRAKVIDWREAVAEHFSRQFMGGDAHLIRITRGYRRSNDEVAVARQVLATSQQLGPLRGMVLLQRAASSVSALEDSLNRWVAERDGGQEPLDDTVEELLDEAPSASVGSLISKEHLDMLEELLQLVERLRSDSRLHCFNGILEELIGAGLRHVVVFCEYRTTLDYLANAVERLDFPKFEFHGGLTHEQRSEVLSRFKEGGGLLITTAASQGVTFNFVEAVIHWSFTTIFPCHWLASPSERGAIIGMDEAFLARSTC